MSLIFAAGFPFTIIKSACLPAAIEPIERSSPRNLAPLKLAILIASTGVKPASTSSSTSRRSPKPATTPPLPVGSRPAINKPPAATKARSKSIDLRINIGVGESAAMRERDMLRDQGANRSFHRIAVEIELPQAHRYCRARTFVGLLIGNEFRIGEKAVLE